MVAVADDPARHLYDPFARTGTGYLNVYLKRGRRDSAPRFVALWKRCGFLRVLGSRPTAREAAGLVAAEYAATYGDRWPLVVRTRRRNPWRVFGWFRWVKRPGRRPRRVLVGWAASVWEWGEERQLGDHLHPTDPRRDWPVARRPWVWPTKAEAKAAVKAWRRDVLPRRWGGLLAPVVCHR